MNNYLYGEDKVYFNLKSLFDSFGYKQYKMRKFEEYSLYAENKSFLKSDYIITFNDLSGKLLALKPDITLSIVKNTLATEQKTEKLYYKESVYRLDRNSKSFREISQIGVELLGNVDDCLTVEIMYLALSTLKSLGENYALDISHMGVISAVLDSYDLTSGTEELYKCISSKNVHDLEAVVESIGAPKELAKTLETLITAEGNGLEVIKKIEKVVPKTAYSAINELKTVYGELEKLGFGGKINFDFSIVSDATYYNGIVFQGYLDKIPKAVLLGGRYDNLVKKFKNNIGGIGFALYLDGFRYLDKAAEYDADVLIEYTSGNINAAMQKALELTSKGLSVRIESTQPKDLRFKEIIKV